MTPIHPHTPSEGRPRVVVAFASTGDVHRETYRSVCEMVDATTRAERVAIGWANDRPHDRCRNEIIRRFLDDATAPRPTHLLFVDTDMIVPRDGLDRLLACNAPIAAGPAPLLLHRAARDEGLPLYGLSTNVLRLADPQLRGTPVPATDASIEYESLDPDEFPHGPFRCDATGLAFCLLHRRVLQSVSPPWCRFIGDRAGERLGEDVYFFRQARQSGFSLCIEPEAMCDHLKAIDITHLDSLYCDDPPRPAWRPNPVTSGFDRLSGAQPLVAICSNGDRLWSLRTAEVVRSWMKRYEGRVRITSIDAGDSASALIETARLHRSDRRPWTHLLLLGHDVVPTMETLEALCSVDAAIVSTLTRGVVNGRVAYTFWQQDPAGGKPAAPQNLNRSRLTAPFPVSAVEPVCSLIRREALDQVRDLRSEYADHPDPTSAIFQAWCARVRAAHASGGSAPIVVVPMTTERWMETGLLAWLQIKTRLKAEGRPPRATLTHVGIPAGRA